MHAFESESSKYRAIQWLYSIAYPYGIRNIFRLSRWFNENIRMAPILHRNNHFLLVLFYPVLEKFFFSVIQKHPHCYGWVPRWVISLVSLDRRRKLNQSLNCCSILSTNNCSHRNCFNYSIFRFIQKYEESFLSHSIVLRFMMIFLYAHTISASHVI